MQTVTELCSKPEQDAAQRSYRRCRSLARLRGAFLLLPLGVLCFAAPLAAQVIPYKELSATRLPYGETLVIQGELADLKANSQPLTDHLEITGLVVRYTVSGLSAKTATATITDAKWQVSIEPLPEKASVAFVFEVQGKLKPERIGEMLDKVLADPRFLVAFDTFAATAASPRAAQELAANNFVDNLAPIFTDALPPFLRASAESPFAAALLDDIEKDLPSLVNFRTNIADMVINKVPGIESGMTAGAAWQAASKLTVQQKQALDVHGQSSLDQFLGNYRRLQVALSRQAVVHLTARSDVTAASVSRDFEKYAGLDVGALYVPQLHELRSFFTLNVYFGRVEESPAPATAAQSSFWQQRVSLTFGVSVGDLSAREDSKIKGDNAFVYGLGFRLNKYVRLTAGGLLFRAASDNHLKHEIFIGPSIDFSAFKYIRGIFGKD